MENNQELNNDEKQRVKISKKINRILISLFVIFIVLIISIVSNYYASREVVDKTDTVKKEEVVPAKRKEAVYSTPKVIYNLSGSIEEINQDFLLLRVKIPELTGERSAEFNGPELRKVSFSDDTKFNRIKFTSIKGTSRSKVDMVDTPREEFLQGDFIEVMANEDIAQISEFEAAQIRKLK